VVLTDHSPGRGVPLLLRGRSRHQPPDQPRPGPVAKIPEFKYCAVKVTRGGEALADGSFGHGHVMADVAVA
jgi:hypothetical protein